MVLIGKGLADAMGVAVGDRITLTGRSSHEQMRRRTMTVVGIYDLSMPEIEKNSVYISLSEAQSLYDLAGQSTEVAIVLQHVGEEAAVMKALQPGLPGYKYSPFPGYLSRAGIGHRHQGRRDECLQRRHGFYRRHRYLELAVDGDL